MSTDKGTNGDTIINVSKIKENPVNYTSKYDPNEISPLKMIPAKETEDLDNNQIQINMSQTAGTDEAVLKQNGKNKIKDTYEAMLTHLDLSQKARIPFLIMITLCATLFIVIISLIVFWPRIPYYMALDVCVERECLEASSQILSWANTSIDVCSDPYEWACGKFENEYREQLELESFGVTGEWNLKTHADYAEISKIHSFIAQMPLTGSSYSAQSTLKGLHTTCMASEMLDKHQGDTELKEAIFSLRGWVYGESWAPNNWDFKEAMTTIQSKYGVFPFFKFSVENRNSRPFGNIIRISEGDYGLRHKMFYNLEVDHKIIKAYKLLLRDFAINFGVVSDFARKFADEVFHFEKRIVNSLPEQRQQVTLSLNEIQKRAPSLPISETITATFPKLNGETLIIVEDVKLLSELSIIASTTDEAPLNNFLTWSLARHFLPFMSREYRAVLQEFNSVLYGIDKSHPTWYFCSKLVKNWMPLAVDAFQHNSRLIMAGSSTNPMRYNDSEKKNNFLIQDRTNYNHELLKMIFYHLRYQLKRSIDENVFIDQEITNFINEKLMTIKIQIGIPLDLLKDTDYINKYYTDFYWRKLHFLDNLEYYWSFKKKKMELMLEPMNNTDKSIFNLFSIWNDKSDKLTQFSVDLNTILVSSRAAEKPYFHYKYPISVNFARIGLELSKSLIEAVYLFGEQYKQEFYETHKLVNKTPTEFSLGDTFCLEKLNDPSIPQRAKDQLVFDITSGRFTAKSFKEFLRLIEASQPIMDSQLPDAVTYDLFDLRRHKRQPGIQPMDDMQLFGLTYMQQFCSVTSGYYKRFKPFVENRISGRDEFDINWNQVSKIKTSLECSIHSKQCEHLL